MALPAPNLQGSLCELAALLRIWVLPRLFSCVLRPLLPLSLLSPLHPVGCLCPPHTLAAAQKLPRCLTPAQRRGGGGGRQLWAAAALHSHTRAGSTPGQTVLNCSGLPLGAGSKPPSLKPFLLQLTPRDEEQCVSVKSFNRPPLLPWRQEQTLQMGTEIQVFLRGKGSVAQ